MATKNLFDYATKELSQDALLRWLFENYNCGVEGVKKICYKVLNAFMDDKDNTIDEGEILDLKTYAQDYKIDVIIIFTLKITGPDHIYLIAIEDKAFSGEHDQLESYNKSLNDLRNWGKYHQIEFKELDIKKVFYKTDLTDVKEQAKVELAGWKSLYIDQIYNIFKDCALPTGSEILDQYINHVIELYHNLNNVSTEKVDEWNKTNFRTYFNNDLVPFAIANRFDVKVDTVVLSYRGYNMSFFVSHFFDKSDSSKQSYKFSLEIIARYIGEKGNVGLSMVLRVSLINDGKEVFIEDTDCFRSGIKKMIQNKYDSSDTIKLFKGRNNKACIGASTDDLNEKIKYHCPKANIDKYLKEAIDSFIEICNHSVSEIESYV